MQLIDSDEADFPAIPRSSPSHNPAAEPSQILAGACVTIVPLMSRQFVPLLAGSQGSGGLGRWIWKGCEFEGSFGIKMLNMSPTDEMKGRPAITNK